MPPHWPREQGTILHRWMVGDPTLPIFCKCPDCLCLVRVGERADDGSCPACGGQSLVECCPLEHGKCSHDITAGTAYCPICELPVCPECGSHDVIQISRVTGYLGDTAGWNAAKRQELKDRHRTDISPAGVPS